MLTGFQKLKLLNLANSPSAEQLQGCSLAWCEALIEARPWEMERDRPVIRDAFVALLYREPRDGHPVYWPAPGDLLVAIPKEQRHAAPYHQLFEDVPSQAKKHPELEWHRNKGNRSVIAKAHAAFNSRRMDLPVPSWCEPANDAERSAIDAITRSLERQVAADVRRVNEGEKAA